VSWEHRIRQFAVRLLARRSPDETLVTQVLPAPAQDLYRGMSAGDQRHGQRVLLALRGAGSWSREVEQAALLHDVGKSQARLTLAHRVAVVALEALAPRLLARLGASAAPDWRRPFHIHLNHAGVGAELCARAGCSPATVALVRAHQDGEGAELSPELQAALAALHRADERA
jgi:hypothetical protein